MRKYLKKKIQIYYGSQFLVIQSTFSQLLQYIDKTQELSQ